MRIMDCSTTLVDVPTRRPHGFVDHQISEQSYLIVKVETEDGIVGVGEGVSPGGPWWGGESVEGQKVIIDRYLSQGVVGGDGARIRQIMNVLDRLAYGNHFAKAAVEMALYDALGKALGAPLHVLLGGRVSEERISVRWPLSSRDSEAAVEEANERHGEGFRAFKFKLGAVDPESDVRRVGGMIEQIPRPAMFQVDPNGAWDRRTAMWALEELAAMAVEVVEQPIARRDLSGMADLVRRSTAVEIMADESVCTPADALAAVASRACDSVAVKNGKAGGLDRALSVGSICALSGVRCFGGTALETSIGTAAAAHLCAALPRLDGGCELVGPLLLADDLVVEGVEYQAGQLTIPQRPGLGVEVDWDKVSKYQRRQDAHSNGGIGKPA